MVQQYTKNEHYIAAGSLKFFADENGRIFEFLVEDKKESYPTTPGKAMSANKIYEHRLFRINEIENAFAEGPDQYLPEVVQNIIKQIESSEKTGDLENTHKEIVKSMGLFLISYYRSGALLEEYSTDGKEKKIALMLRKLLDVNYLTLLAKTINNLYKFAIIESNNEFLISDQYISTAALKVKSHFVEVSNRHIGLKETIILIPLTSKYYAVFWNSDSKNIFNEEQINLVMGSELENINRVILNNSYKKCVGRKKEVCDYIKNKFIHESPSVVFSPDYYFIRKKEVFWYEQEAIFWKSFKMHKQPEVFNCGRNDLCPCRSGKKFKKCHMQYENWWNNLIEDFDGGYPFINLKGEKGKKYIIKDAPIIEGPIDQKLKILVNRQP